MKRDENKKERLIKAVEEYNNSIDSVIDYTYKLIDGNCHKTDVSFVMSRHKEKLKKLESLLKTY